MVKNGTNLWCYNLTIWIPQVDQYGIDLGQAQVVEAEAGSGRAVVALVARPGAHFGRAEKSHAEIQVVLCFVRIYIRKRGFVSYN